VRYGGGKNRGKEVGGVRKGGMEEGEGGGRKGGEEGE
jgi:hypothetical protein